MNDIISAYYSFLSLLDRIKKYTEKTYVKNNGLQSIIDNYQGENKELLDYYNSIKESQIQYNAIIITLYGAYENYIDNISKCYLTYIFNNCDPLTNIPVNIRDTYRKNIGDLLSNPQRFGFNIEAAENAAKKFCMYLDANYSNIEYDVLLNHSGNLKSSQLEDYLRSLSLLENSNLFDSYFIEKYYYEYDFYDNKDFETKRRRKSADLFKPLNDLVESRNNVAHTGEDSSRISTRTIIHSTIPFLKVLSRVVLECILNTAVSLTSVESKFTNIAVFDNRILCTNNKGHNIKTGGVVIYRHNETIKNAIIRRIELNKKSIDETGKESINVGLELDNKIDPKDIIIDII
jgi:hypothetical protein